MYLPELDPRISDQLVLPIPISFHDFLGPYKMGGIYGLLHGNRTMRMIPDREWLLGDIRGGYQIWRAKHARSPEKHERLFARRGHAVLVTLENVPVAGGHEHYGWVHPDHVRSGLGMHMAVHWFLISQAEKTDWRLTPEGREKHGIELITRPGLDTRVLTYRKMVEWGFVVDPTEKISATTGYATCEHCKGVSFDNDETCLHCGKALR